MISSRDLLRRSMLLNFVEDGEYLYFWDRISRALFRCEKGSQTADTETLFMEKDSTDVNGQYSKVVLWKDKIIGVPSIAWRIFVYDKSTGEVRFADLPSLRWKPEVLEKEKIWDVVTIGKYAYIIGFWSPYLLKFNMESEQVDGVIDLYEHLPDVEGETYLRFGTVAGGKLLIPSCAYNLVFIVDPEDLSYTTERIDGIKRGFSAIYADGDDIWLTPRFDGPIIRWSWRTGETYPLDRYPKGVCVPDKYGWGFIAKAGRDLYFFPQKANCILKLDTETGNIEIEKVINQYVHRIEGRDPYTGQWYTMACQKENVLYAYTLISRELLIYDTKTEKLTVRNFSSAAVLSERFFALGKVTVEEDILLTDLLLALHSSGSVPEQKLQQEPAGQQIYAAMKKIWREGSG